MLPALLPINKQTLGQWENKHLAAQQQQQQQQEEAKEEEEEEADQWRGLFKNQQQILEP